MTYKKLTVIIPVFNERRTIAEAIRRAREQEIPVGREVIVVDDGSTDGTQEVVKQLLDSTVRLIEQPQNQGKGAAVRAGIASATGDVLVIYDADLEYDPRDWVAMLRPMNEGLAKVVYGSRFTGERRNMMFWHWVGNRFLSLTTNILYNTTISDMETCSKMIDTQVAQGLTLVSNRFDIEPEITAKLLRSGHRIWEVPIRYAGREVDEGKKISWKDGFPALWALVKWRFVPKRTWSRS